MRRIAAALAALLVFAVAGAVALVATPVWASASTRAQAIDPDLGIAHIVAFNAEYVVARDDSATITETIDYDFGVVPRHGIQRDLVLKQRFDDSHDRVYPLHVLSVAASAGTPAQWRVLDQPGGIKRIRIGDPDRTITGRHRYVITYRLGSVLNGFRDHDELYWNVTGDQWLVPIGAVTVQVHTPTAVTGATCFVGPRGSNVRCASSRTAPTAATATDPGASGGTVTFTNGRLVPGSELTMVVGFVPQGVTTPHPILRERWSFTRAFAATAITVSVAIVIFLAAALLVAGLLWRRGRDRRAAGSAIDMAFPTAGAAEEQVAFAARTDGPMQFEPPDKLRPGQLGVLVDERANPIDVTATIVDLAARGYLTIEETQTERWFRKPDWTLHRKQDSDGVLPYERKLLDGLFTSGDTVKVSELRNKFAERMRKVENALYDDAVKQGWYLRRPDKVRGFWHAMGVVALVIAVGLTVLLAKFTHLGLLGVPLVLGALALLVAARWMPSRTAKGTGVLVRAMGFRRFMVESDPERMHFAERQNLFYDYLPYAVVFGVTEKWAHAFAGLAGEQPPPSWYVSGHPFEVAAFAHAVDGFTVTSAGTLTSTPGSSGSSGFSGGSAGGGGGGGGGGSW
jgi:uncharacterized membrane protein YgcG